MALRTNATNGEHVYLIDTQADICVIKEEHVVEYAEIDYDNIIDISGVTDGLIESIGSINTEIVIDNTEIPITFHVVPNKFNIGTSGLLGKDFLKSYECEISYRKMTLNFIYNDQKFTLPIVTPLSSRHVAKQCEKSEYKTQNPTHVSLIQGRLQREYSLRKQSPHQLFH